MKKTTKVYNEVLYDKRLTISAIRLISYIIDKNENSQDNQPIAISRRQILEDVHMNVDTYKNALKRLFECEYLEKKDDAPYGIVQWKLKDTREGS